MTLRARRIAAPAAVLAVLLALGLGAGTASAEETGRNAWCFRPYLLWTPVLTEAYVPTIHCEARELPADEAAQWSGPRLAAPAVAPEDWSLPARSLRSTRWGWVHEYNASSGVAYVYGEMSRVRGESPPGGDATVDVVLSVACDATGALHVSLVSDVVPLEDAHAIVWWTDRGNYRHAERWDAEEISAGSRFFRGWASAPDRLWAAISRSSQLYVLIFGDRSWRSAEADVRRINQLTVVEILDYCGQDDPAGDAANG